MERPNAGQALAGRRSRIKWGNGTLALNSNRSYTGNISNTASLVVTLRHSAGDRRDQRRGQKRQYRVADQCAGQQLRDAVLYRRQRRPVLELTGGTPTVAATICRLATLSAATTQRWISGHWEWLHQHNLNVSTASTLGNALVVSGALKVPCSGFLALADLLAAVGIVNQANSAELGLSRSNVYSSIFRRHATCGTLAGAGGVLIAAGSSQACRALRSPAASALRKQGN